MPETTILFERLAVAVAIGLLIGLERGWKTRDVAEGERVAGVRTFTVVGMLGGLSALLVLITSAVTMAAALIGMGVLLGLNHWAALQRDKDIGSTTVLASLATFALGALAGFGELAPAGAAAVVLVAILGVKQQLHGFVARISEAELMAVIQLLAISVVLLPILPDKGYGPFGALNPYRIWWMVVLIAGLSFVGYAAVKIVGSRRGMMLTGLLGGLASSTATTVNMARLSRRAETPEASALLAASAVTANATMFPRVLLIVAVVAPELVRALAWPLGLATVGAAVGVLLLLWATGPVARAEGLQPRNPFELRLALQFALLLAAVMFLAKALKAWVGDAGLYVLSVVSGLSDVDAITLSLGSMASSAEIEQTIAVIGVALAVAANTLVKPALVIILGRSGMALRMLLPLGLAIGAGVAGLYMVRLAVV